MTVTKRILTNMITQRANGGFDWEAAAFSHTICRNMRKYIPEMLFKQT